MAVLTNAWIHGWKEECTKQQAGGSVNKINEWMDGWTDVHMEGGMNMTFSECI